MGGCVPGYTLSQGSARIQTDYVHVQEIILGNWFL